MPLVDFFCETCSKPWLVGWWDQVGACRGGVRGSGHCPSGTSDLMGWALGCSCVHGWVGRVTCFMVSVCVTQGWAWMAVSVCKCVYVGVSLGRCLSGWV